MAKKETKKKKNGFKIAFWITLSVLIIVILLNFLNSYDNSDDGVPLNDSEITTQAQTNDNMTFLHFSTPVTYRFSSTCVGRIVPRIEWALDIIENETDGLVTFEQVSSEAEIDFICTNESNTYAIGDYATRMIYGESSIEIVSDPIIEKARIKFWSVKEDTSPPSCYTFPSLELHEIMHSFGFDHNDYDKYSLMYPDAWQECVAKNVTITLHSTGETFVPEDKIDDNIVSCLKFIYSNGEQGSCNDVYRTESDCPIGWYPDKWDEYCCPEPNMIINDEGDCDYSL
jgi:hypothetical protein